MIDRVAVLCVAAAALALLPSWSWSCRRAVRARNQRQPQRARRRQSAPATSRIRGPRVDELIETTLSRPLFAPDSASLRGRQKPIGRPIPGLGNIRFDRYSHRGRSPSCRLRRAWGQTTRPLGGRGAERMAPRQHFLAGGFVERRGRIHHLGAEKRSDAGAADPGCSTHGHPTATFRNRRSTVIASSGRPAAKTAAALPRGPLDRRVRRTCRDPGNDILRRGSRSALVAITLFALAACDSPLAPPALTPLETPSALQPCSAAHEQHDTARPRTSGCIRSPRRSERACLARRRHREYDRDRVR